MTLWLQRQTMFEHLDDSKQKIERSTLIILQAQQRAFFFLAHLSSPEGLYHTKKKNLISRLPVTPPPPPKLIIIKKSYPFLCCFLCLYAVFMGFFPEYGKVQTSEADQKCWGTHNAFLFSSNIRPYHQLKKKEEKKESTQPSSTCFQAKIRKYLKLSTKPPISSPQSQKNPSYCFPCWCCIAAFLQSFWICSELVDVVVVIVKAECYTRQRAWQLSHNPQHVGIASNKVLTPANWWLGVHVSVNNKHCC